MTIYNINIKTMAENIPEAIHFEHFFDQMTSKLPFLAHN